MTEQLREACLALSTVAKEVAYGPALTSEVRHGLRRAIREAEAALKTAHQPQDPTACVHPFHVRVHQGQEPIDDTRIQVHFFCGDCQELSTAVYPREWKER